MKTKNSIMRWQYVAPTSCTGLLMQTLKDHHASVHFSHYNATIKIYYDS